VLPLKVLAALDLQLRSPPEVGSENHLVSCIRATLITELALLYVQLLKLTGCIVI